MKWPVLVSMLLIVVSGAVYLRSLGGSFVYDDHRFVAANPAVVKGRPFSAYFSDPATQAAGGGFFGLWRPLRTLSFRAVWALCPGALGQRVANLAVHLLNGILLFFLLRKLLGVTAFPALVGALAFVLHPLAAEPVAWVSGRGDLLAVTGMLAAVLLYLTDRRSGRALAAVVFLMALLFKESAVVLPVVLVVVDGYRGGLARIREKLRHYVPFVAVLMLYLAARAVVLAGGFSEGAGRGLSRANLFFTQFTAVLDYLWTTLVPVRLMFEFNLTPAWSGPLLAALGLCVVTALGVVAYRLRRRGPEVTLAILLFCVMLLPVTLLQLVFPLKILVANRFAYPALVAFGILVAAVFRRSRPFAVVTALLLFAFIPLTMDRTQAFRSDRALWSDVLAKDPSNARALYGLGTLEAHTGHRQRAVDLLERSIRLDPGHPGKHALLAELLEEIGGAAGPRSATRRLSFPRAIDQYQKAIGEWRAGNTEERHLFSFCLVKAAYLSLVVDGARSLPTAKRDAEDLLSTRMTLPSDTRGRQQLGREVLLLAKVFQRVGVAKLARELFALHSRLTTGERG